MLLTTLNQLLKLINLKTDSRIIGLNVELVRKLFVDYLTSLYEVEKLITIEWDE